MFISNKKHVAAVMIQQLTSLLSMDCSIIFTRWCSCICHLIPVHGSLYPHMSLPQTGLQSVQPFFPGWPVWLTDRQTDRQTEKHARHI